METVLRGTAMLFADMAEKSARQKERRARSTDLPSNMYVRVLKVLLHLGGFGAFVWSMFEVHSVAGGLAIMVSCFTLSWLMPSKTSTNADANVDPGLRR